ncbi:MAG: hypothetical protein EBR82_71140 [Caulobacteraceae bacterium]|nr:hypothetical protein [Caulobacteraceae bacterium]
MNPSVETEYRVSERVTLRPGDRFRVGAGPYYRLASGERVPMAVRGIVTFRRAIRCGRGGRRVLIEAQAGEGTVILHVAGPRSNRLVPGLVCRPYAIRGKLRAGEKSRRARKAT